MNRIAVTYEDGNVFGHFGHTERFKIYDIDNGKVKAATLVNTNQSGHGALADILKKMNVDTLICGGIGGGARIALDEVGITVYAGVEGNADKALEALLNNKLDFDPNARCSHHDETHHENCSGGGCGGEHHCK